MDVDTIVAIIREGDKEKFSNLDQELLQDKLAYDYTRNFLVAYGKFPEEETLYKDLRLTSMPVIMEPSAYYIDKLRERRKMDKMHGILSTSSEVLKKSINIDDGMSEIRKLLIEIDSQKQETGFIEVATTALERWEEYQERAKFGGLLGISSPWEELDSMTLGWCEGNVIIVVGPTEIGKSWWLTKQFEHSFQQGDRPLFASIELIAKTVVDRFDAVYCKVDHGDLRAGKLDSFSETTYQTAMTTLSTSESRAWVADSSMVATPDQLRHMINRVEPKIVLLDGLYLMRTGDPRGQNWEKVAEVVRQLQLIASEFKVPIIATSQFTRQVKKGTKGGDISDIGYSHSIAQAADVGIALKQSDYDFSNHEMFMEIIKGREFKKSAKQLKIKWDVPRNFEFVELAEVLEDEPSTAGEVKTPIGTGGGLYDDKPIDLGE